jgi:hypothetical protein
LLLIRCAGGDPNIEPKKLPAVTEGDIAQRSTDTIVIKVPAIPGQFITALYVQAMPAQGKVAGFAEGFDPKNG